MGDAVDEALRLMGRLVAFAVATAAALFMLGIAFKPVFPDGLPPGTERTVVFLLLFALALVIAQILMVAVAERGDWRHSGLGKAGWSPLVIAFGLGLGALVQGLMPLVVHFTGIAEPGTAAWVPLTSTVVQLVVLTTLVETLALRGYVIGLIASRWGDIAAIVITALLAMLFAALLATQGQALTRGMIGLAFLHAAFLGALRLRTGSLLAAWLAHLVGALIARGAGDGLPVATASVAVVVTFLLLKLLPQSKPTR